MKNSIVRKLNIISNDGDKNIQGLTTESQRLVGVGVN
jgi:hypothetical protein